MSLPGCEEVAAIRRRLLSPVSCGDQKSYDEARRLKELGNAQFRKKHKSELQKALQCYSKALLFAPWPATNEEAMRLAEHLVSCKPNLATVLDNTSPSVKDGSLLATCFGNRSAVLYELGKLEECLADIKRALAFGFPEASEYKLYRRQAWCLAQKGKEKEAHEALDKAMEMIRKSNQSQEQLLKEQRSLRNKLQEILKHAKTRVMNTGTQLENLHGDQICGAYESKHVCIRSTPEKGRFLEATHDVTPGEVVILEEPFAAILNEDFTYTHCSHCFQESRTLVPCRWCASEGYCCPECRQMAWRKCHWMECPVANLWKKCDWTLQLCLRIVLSAEPTELAAAVQQCDSSPELFTKCDRNSRDPHYSSICSLVVHKDKFSDSSQKILIEKMAGILTGCFGEVILRHLKNRESAEGRTEISPMVPSNFADAREPTSLEESQTRCLPGLTLTQLRNLFLHHLLQLRCNTHTISTVQEEGASGSESVQTMSEVQLGSAVYPTASLMNHSCHPNAIFRFTGNRVAVCATREIQAGEEINICYGPQVGRVKRAERLAELKRKFFFDCHCPACEGDTTELSYREVVMDAFACQGCQGALQELGENYHQCLKCKCACTLGKEKRELKEARSMFETACMCGNTVNLPLLLECQKLQSRVLHAHNMELARTNDIIARAYATQGDFSSACGYGELSCRAVEAVYGSCSIELANEQQKLAQLYFHSQRYREALESARQAHSTLVIYHSSHHPDCIELHGLIEILSGKI